jgi:type II secretory pathway component PulF
MPTFKYKIRDKHGRASTGIIDSESKDSVAAHFKRLGYIPTQIQEESLFLDRFKSANIFFRRASLGELIVFTRQLMVLQRAGVPILSSLDSIREQTQNKYFKEIISQISRSIESGESLSDTLSKFPEIFSDIYVSMIRAGEAAGILDEVLDRLGTLLEYELDLRMKIKQATRYPVLVLIVLSLAFIFAVLFIIPKFAELFSSFKVPLPLPTRFLIGLNFVLANFGGYIIIALAILFIPFRYLVRAKGFRSFVDTAKLKIPVLGPLFLKIAMSRFNKTSSMLIASGIPLLNTLTIVKGTVGNKIVADSIEVIKEGIGKGEGMAVPMKLTGLFPAIVVQMVKIGEDTGKIDYLLLRVSEYYDGQIDYTVKNLAALIEPFLLLILGALILLLALGVFMPMWNLIQLYKI